jgi:hypothetical protein
MSAQTPPSPFLESPMSNGPRQSLTSTENTLSIWLTVLAASQLHLYLALYPKTSIFPSILILSYFRPPPSLLLLSFIKEGGQKVEAMTKQESMPIYSINRRLTQHLVQTYDTNSSYIISKYVGLYNWSFVTDYSIKLRFWHHTQCVFKELYGCILYISY